MNDPELATAPLDDHPEASTGSPRGPGFVLAVALGVVLAVVAAGLAGALVTREDSDDGLDELRTVAGRFGEVLVTYDYHDPDAHKDAVLALASGSFRQDYEDAFDQGLGQIITQVEAVSQGTVNDVFLSSVDGGQAQAVVSLDVEVSGTSGQRTLLDQYVLLTLIKLEGGWKVDQVTDLSFPTSTNGTSPGTTGSTTTTAVPSGTSVP